MDNSSLPNLDWPEEAYGNERELFYAALLETLGPAEWAVIVPTPVPIGAVRRAIEANCKNLLQPMKMAYDGVAWLCPWSSIARVLPGLFHGRRPELAFLAFDSRPKLNNVTTALQSADGHPAIRILLFEDGELVEKREATTR